jgi:hypothetical protein
MSEVENNEVEEAVEAPVPGIGLQDIAACVQIIDIVTKRGAFEGSELADVGTVRNRLSAFLDANKPAETEEPKEEEEEA